MPPTLPLIQAGKVRALAVTGKKRSASLPGGADYRGNRVFPGYEAVLWQALAAPAGTPAPVIAKLNREMTEILAEPATIAALDKQGVEADPSTPKVARRAHSSDDIDKWRGVDAKAGIKP